MRQLTTTIAALGLAAVSLAPTFAQRPPSDTVAGVNGDITIHPITRIEVRRRDWYVGLPPMGR
jgi:hypothetical protein